MNRNKKGQAAPKAARAPKKGGSASQQTGGGRSRQMMSAPVAQSRKFLNSEPQISSSSNGDIRVRHREYFADLSGSVAFATNSFSVNPGLASMFPWLSQVAGRYETYRVNRLRFSYETEAATSATGTVLIVLDTDAADAAPVSKSDALTYKIKNRGAPWQPFDLDAPRLDDMGGLSRKYVRQGSLAANLDIKTYDVGTLYPCTIGQANTNVVGELYVEYDISFYTPQIIPSVTQSAKISDTAGLASNVMFGTSPTITGSLPISVNATGDTLTFNSECELYVNATFAGTVMSGNLANAGTCTFTAQTAVYNSGATTGSAPCIIRASPGQTFIPSVTATTITSMNWRLADYQYSLA